MKNKYSYDMALSARTRNESLDKNDRLQDIIDRARFEDEKESQPTTVSEVFNRNQWDNKTHNGWGIPDYTRDATDF